MDMEFKRSLRVLVFDDIELAQGYMKYSLETVGLRNIVYESHPQRASRLIKTKQFDIVLCAYSAKTEADGFHMIEDLKHTESLPHQTSVIFVSADNERAVVRRIIELQPDGLIIKPYSVKQFDTQIHRVCARLQFSQSVLRLMDDNEPEQALIQANKLLAKYASHPYRDSIKRLKGLLLLTLERYQDAHAFFTAEQNPNNSWASLGVIQSLEKLGRVEEAEQQLFNFSLAPQNELLALDIFTQRHIDDQQYNDALESAKMAAELSPLNRQRQQQIFELSRVVRDTEAQYQSAQMLLKLTKDSVHHSPQLLLNVARAGLDHGQFLHGDEINLIERQVKQQINAYQRQCNKSGSIPEIKVLESRLAYLKNKQAQAKAFLNALSLNDFDEPTMDDLLDLSKAYHHINDQHNAEAVMQHAAKRAKQKHSDNPVIQSVIKQQYKLQKSIVESPRVLNDLGVKYFNQHDYLNAFKQFWRAHTLLPKRVSIALNLLQSIAYLPQSKYPRKLNMDNVVSGCVQLLESTELSSEQQSTFDKLQDILTQRV